jgi:hypothetical protein
MIAKISERDTGFFRSHLMEYRIILLGMQQREKGWIDPGQIFQRSFDE